MDIAHHLCYATLPFMIEYLAIALYFSCLIFYALMKQKKSLTQTDFVIGNRSLSKWTTALAVHASDMSNWLFMGYPAGVYLKGGGHIWVAIGLLAIMWINWVAVAPKIRSETAKTNTITLIGFFEERLGSHWPKGRVVTAIFLLIFYTCYVSATLWGMGLLLQSLFPLSYSAGVLIGALLILPYISVGGYSTLARVDLFQGIFLLGVILFVPIYISHHLGGVNSLFTAIAAHGKSFALVSSGNLGSIWKDLLLMFGWGIGYLGQPHILTKFMGIKDPKQLPFSRRIGMSWQFLALAAASLVGFVGIAVFGNTLADPEQVFIQLIRGFFPPFFIGLFLCAIIAAILNAVSSMLLVLSTTLVEDLYKKHVRPNAREKQQIWMSRLACVISALVGVSIALMKIGTINSLVFYAWSGLGACFGPLVIATLYLKRVTTEGAWIGMLLGGSLVALGPFIFPPELPSLTIAFPVAFLSIYWISKRSVTHALSGK